MAGFSQGLQQLTQQRQRAITELEKLTQLFDAAVLPTLTGEDGAIATARQQVQHVTETLRQGTFRIVVLGDMKRGKSTLLNALLGEPLLPSDVNPCTALLTIIRHGDIPQVTLHYNGEASEKPRTQTLDFDTFKREYTIPPETARQLAEKDEAAFPDISHAVVTYPLPWLESGIELVDTPGLNDTEARNQQVLGYLNEAQAIVFVLSATQPITLDERRYLKNYLSQRGLPVFFLINGFDRIRAGLVNPEDDAATETAENQIRDTFKTALAETFADQPETYEQRVFETSALEALRQRISGIPLEATHLAPFLTALQQFLVQERGQTALTRAMLLTQQAQRSVAASVARQVPMLDDSLAEIEAKVASVQSDFKRLEGIRDQYRQLIRESCDRTATELSNDFKTYLVSLSDTFEQDFTDSQPDLDFLEFLQREKREEFYRAFKRAFERYINDRLAAWEFTAKQKIGQAFDELNDSASDYQVAYAEVVEVIHEKLMGRRFYAVGQKYNPDDVKVWTDNIQDLFEEIPENLNSAVNSFNMFWQSVLQMVLVYVCVSIVLQLVGLMFSSLFLNIVGVIAAAGGVLAAQAAYVRQEFLKATKQAFAQYLPQVASEQKQSIYRAVKDCFKTYETQAIDRISADIAARRVELSDLVKQKQDQQTDQQQQRSQLQQLAKDSAAIVDQLETVVQTNAVV